MPEKVSRVRTRQRMALRFRDRLRNGDDHS